MNQQSQGQPGQQGTAQQGAGQAPHGTGPSGRPEAHSAAPTFMKQQGVRNEAVAGPFTVRDLTVFAATLVLFVASLIPMFAVRYNLWNLGSLFFLGLGVVLPLIVAALFAARRLAPDTKVIVLSETERIEDILQVFKCGASGYIPQSIGLEVAVSALHLVAAGGLYVPASVLSAQRELSDQQANGTKVDQSGIGFTSKQLAVIEALCRGKSNKIIAYDLNMCESTVKVHVRKVMKTLGARSRTEAAYILSEKLNGSVRTHVERFS